MDTAVVDLSAPDESMFDAEASKTTSSEEDKPKRKQRSKRQPKPRQQRSPPARNRRSDPSCGHSQPKRSRSPSPKLRLASVVMQPRHNPEISTRNNSAQSPSQQPSNRQNAPSTKRPRARKRRVPEQRRRRSSLDHVPVESRSTYDEYQRRGINLPHKASGVRPGLQDGRAAPIDMKKSEGDDVFYRPPRFSERT